MPNKMNEIQAVIFDLGRVLVNIDNTLLIEKLFKGLEVKNLQELGRKTMCDPTMVEFNTGRIGPVEFHQRMREAFNVEPDFKTFKQLWCKIFYTMEGMEELVCSLGNRLTIGLLIDTDPIHWKYLSTTWPWIGQIKNPTLSYEVGVMKPDAKIYLAAAQNVDTAPQHCLFVDDLEVNVQGARAVGMQAIRFESPTALSEQLVRIGL